MDQNSPNCQTRQINLDGRPYIETKRRVKVRRRRIKNNPCNIPPPPYDTPVSMNETTEDETTYYYPSSVGQTQLDIPSNQITVPTPVSCLSVGPVGSAITSPCTFQRPFTESPHDVNNYDAAPCTFRSTTSLPPEYFPQLACSGNEDSPQADMTPAQGQMALTRKRVKVKVKKYRGKIAKRPECLVESKEMVEGVSTTVPSTSFSGPRRVSSPTKCADAKLPCTSSSSKPADFIIRRTDSPPSTREELTQWSSRNERVCRKAKNAEEPSMADQINVARLKMLNKVPFDDLGPEQKLEYLRIKQDLTGSEWQMHSPIVEKLHSPLKAENSCDRLPRTPIATSRHSIHVTPSESAIISIRSSKLFPPDVSSPEAAFVRNQAESFRSVDSASRTITPTSSRRKPPKLDAAAFYVPDAESQPKPCGKESPTYMLSARGTSCQPSTKSLKDGELTPCARKSPCQPSTKLLCESMKHFSVASHPILTPSMFTPESSFQRSQSHRSAIASGRQTPLVPPVQQSFQRCTLADDTSSPVVTQEKVMRLANCAETKLRPSPCTSRGFRTPRGSLPLPNNLLEQTSACKSVYFASVPSKMAQTPSQAYSQEPPFFERFACGASLSVGCYNAQTPPANSEKRFVPKVNVTSNSPCGSHDSMRFDTNTSRCGTTPQPSVFVTTMTPRTSVKSFGPNRDMSENSRMDEMLSKGSVRTRDGDLVFVNPLPEPSIKVINSISSSLSRRTPPKTASSDLTEMTQHSQQLVEEVITSAIKNVGENETEDEETDQQEDGKQEVTSRRESINAEEDNSEDRKSEAD